MLGAHSKVVCGLSHLYLSRTVLWLAWHCELSWAWDRWLIVVPHRDTLKVVNPRPLPLIRCLWLYLDGWELSTSVLTVHSSRLSDGWLSLVELLVLAYRHHCGVELTRLDAIGLHLIDTCSIQHASKAGRLVIGARNDSQVAFTWGSDDLVVLWCIVWNVVGCVSALGLPMRLNSRSCVCIGRHTRLHESLTTGWVVWGGFLWRGLGCAHPYVSVGGYLGHEHWRCQGWTNHLNLANLTYLTNMAAQTFSLNLNVRLSRRVLHSRLAGTDRAQMPRVARVTALSSVCKVLQNVCDVRLHLDHVLVDQLLALRYHFLLGKLNWASASVVVHGHSYVLRCLQPAQFIFGHRKRVSAALSRYVATVVDRSVSAHVLQLMLFVGWNLIPWCDFLYAIDASTLLGGPVLDIILLDRD